MADLLKDQASVKDILQKAQLDNSIKWVAFGYIGGGTVIEILDSGYKGLSEVEKYLKEDSVVYILYGYTKIETADSGESVIEKIKYILITFVGSEVKPFHRARSSQHRVYLYNFIGSHLSLAGELQATLREDISDEKITKKLSGSMLEHHSEAQIKMTTGGTTHNNMQSGQDVLHFSNEEQSVQLIKNVRLDSDPTKWVAWSYQMDNSSDLGALKVTSSGSGTYSDIEKLLTPSRVLFVLLALDTVSEGDYASTKYALVTWVPPDVRPLLKARSAQDRLQLRNFINKYLQLGAEWQATTLEEISESKLLHKLQGSVIQEKKDVSKQKFKSTVNDGISKVNLDYNPPTEVGVIEWQSEEQELISASEIRCLRDESKNWTSFGYKGSNTKITFLKSGTEGFDEILALIDEKSVIYFVLGIEFGIGDYIQKKFAFITWVGPKSKPTSKARASQHRISLYHYLSSIIPIAGELQALNFDEISIELIRKKLIGTSQLNEEQQQSTQRRKRVSNFSDTVSQNFQFDNPSQVEATLKEIKDDSNTLNWVTLVYKSDSSFISVGKSGSGGLNDIKPILMDDQVVYAILGIVQDFQDYQAIKYVLITSIGQKVKPIQMARSSQHRLEIARYVQKFLQLAIEVQISTPDDLNEKELLSKLGGSRVLTECQSKTCTRRPTISKAPIEKFSLENESLIKSVLENVVSESPDSPDWALFGNVEGKSNILTLLATGKGQLHEVKKNFNDSNFCYAVISYKFVEIVEDVDYTRRKNIFISWLGPNIKPFERAKSSQNRVNLYNYCLSIIQLHGQLDAQKLSDLQNSDIDDKVSGVRTQDESKIEAARSQNKAESKSKRNQSDNTSEDVKVDISSFFKQYDVAEDLLKSLKKSSLTWVALGYHLNDETSVTILDSGSGDLSSFNKLLKPDQAVYVIVSILENETVSSYATKKIVQINWVGSQVKPLQRARSSQHRVAIATQLVGKYLQLAAEFPASDLSQITLTNLQDKITGNSFKPL